MNVRVTTFHARSPCVRCVCVPALIVSAIKCTVAILILLVIRCGRLAHSNVRVDHADLRLYERFFCCCVACISWHCISILCESLSVGDIHIT